VTARSGVLVVDKTAGVTSFDAVGMVRRRLGIRRVGHAGTLDPDALGVLPLLLGEATKLTPYLVDQEKEYVATLRLGVTTDTQDLSGRVLTASASTPRVELTALEAACRRFTGKIKQVPPMYSAVHHEGRRLYELAREGREVDRQPREVVVRSIAVERLEGPTVTLRVVCGKGTYIRTLAADLGSALGWGAAVERLTRTRVGPFERDGAVPWAALTTAPTQGLWGRVQPPGSALAGWPGLCLDGGAIAAFVNGQAVDAAEGEFMETAAPGVPAADAAAVAAAARRWIRVHDRHGALVGIGEILAGGRIRPVRILHADRPGTPVVSC
jgi:tRNA pseudouridine55 synthase